MNEKISFEIGTHHTNNLGEYEVLKPHGEKHILVRWVDGEKAGTEQVLEKGGQIRILTLRAQTSNKKYGISGIPKHQLPIYAYTLGLIAQKATFSCQLKVGEWVDQFVDDYASASGINLKDTVGQEGTFTYINHAINLWGSAYEVIANFAVLKQHPKFYDLTTRTGLQVYDDVARGNDWWMTLANLGFVLGKKQDALRIMDRFSHSHDPEIRGMEEFFFEGYTEDLSWLFKAVKGE